MNILGNFMFCCQIKVYYKDTFELLFEIMKYYFFFSLQIKYETHQMTINN